MSSSTTSQTFSSQLYGFMNNNRYSHYGLIDNSSNNRKVQNSMPNGGMGGLELKSLVMINNFIIDHQNQQVVKQEGANTPGHNRSTSMGIQQTPNYANLHQQLKAEKRVRNLSCNPQQTVLNHVSVCVPSRFITDNEYQTCYQSVNLPPQSINQIGPKKHLLSDFIERFPKQTGAQASQSPQQTEKHRKKIISQIKPVPISQAINNLKSFIQNKYPVSSSIQPKPKQQMKRQYQASKSQGQLQQATKTKRDLSVREQPPLRMPLHHPQMLPLPQKNLNDELMRSNLNVSDLDESINDYPDHEEQDDLNEDTNIDQSITNDQLIPIPAFTSAELAQKHRQHKSEERYINEQMECELEQYKEEIERRFKNSSINKGYVFPRKETPIIQKPLIPEARKANKENQGGIKEALNTDKVTYPYGTLESFKQFQVGNIKDPATSKQEFQKRFKDFVSQNKFQTQNKVEQEKRACSNLSSNRSSDKYVSHLRSLSSYSGGQQQVQSTAVSQKCLRVSDLNKIKALYDKLVHPRRNQNINRQSSSHSLKSAYNQEQASSRNPPTQQTLHQIGTLHTYQNLDPLQSRLDIAESGVSSEYYQTFIQVPAIPPAQQQTKKYLNVRPHSSKGMHSISQTEKPTKKTKTNFPACFSTLYQEKTVQRDKKQIADLISLNKSGKSNDKLPTSQDLIKNFKQGQGNKHTRTSSIMNQQPAQSSNSNQINLNLNQIIKQTVKTYSARGSHGETRNQSIYHSRAKTTLFDNYSCQTPVIQNQRYSYQPKKAKKPQQLSSQSSYQDLNIEQIKQHTREELERIIEVQSNILQLRLQNDNLIVESRPQITLTSTGKYSENINLCPYKSIHSEKKLTSSTNLQTTRIKDYQKKPIVSPYTDRSLSKNQSTKELSSDKKSCSGHRKNIKSLYYSDKNPFTLHSTSSTHSLPSHMKKESSVGNLQLQKITNSHNSSLQYLKTEESQKSTDKKRNFKVKCLKIDLYRPAGVQIFNDQ